jgi:hypothetical protein
MGAPVAELVISQLLGSFGLMAGFMPILALAAQAAPAGLEAFGYSLLLFTMDLGTSSGSLLSAQLTKVGPGRCRPPHHRMPINSRDWVILHVDDVASNVAWQMSPATSRDAN